MPASLAERLGHAPDARLLIVNCDDLGSSRSSNVAVYDALREGIATSATLMVPCPWAREAAAQSAGLDVGVHLTLTAEYPGYRWRSLTNARSLHDKDGFLPRTAEEVWTNADPADAEAECRAQIEQALAWGVDVTGLRVDPTGNVIVVTGAAPQGQGHVTMFSHLVGDLLGIDPDTIDVRTGDTALVAQGGGTYGSRTAAIGGSAALLAGRAVRDKAIRVAAHLLEAAAADIVCNTGTFSVRGLPSRTVGWADLRR